MYSDRVAEPIALSVDEDRHRQRTIQHDRIVKSIRLRPGFENFLLPQRFRDLTSILEDVEAGPVIFVNVAHALILEGHSLKVVWLPGLTEQCAGDLRSRYQEHLKVRGLRERAIYPSGRGIRKSESDAFRLVLGQLWKLVARPVLDALNLVSALRSSQVETALISLFEAGRSFA